VAWTAVSRPWIGALDELPGCVSLRAMASESELSVGKSCLLTEAMDFWHCESFIGPGMVS
ncbi:unnamed protein product, partial [Musa acuminata subsp. burmannicoides]